MHTFFDWRWWKIILKKYNDIFHIVSNSIENIDSKNVYSKRFLKSKIKFHGDNATDFQDKKIPNVGSNVNCLAVILIDFVLKKKKKTSKCFWNNVNIYVDIILIT